MKNTKSMKNRKEDVPCILHFMFFMLFMVKNVSRIGVRVLGTGEASPVNIVSDLAIVLHRRKIRAGDYRASTASNVAVAAGILIVIGAGYYLEVTHPRQVAQRSAETVRLHEQIEQRALQFQKAWREGQILARYHPATESFSVVRLAARATAEEIPERELADFVLSSGIAEPRVLVVYPSRLFPRRAQQARFESRVGSELFSAGATSVTFGMDPTPNAI